METPYLVEVDQKDIEKFLRIIKKHNFLDSIKITTVLGDSFSKEEIDDILNGDLNDELSDDDCLHCKFLGFRNSFHKCKICNVLRCENHITQCSFCKEFVCENHIYTHERGGVCNSCNKYL